MKSDRLSSPRSRAAFLSNSALRREAPKTAFGAPAILIRLLLSHLMAGPPTAKWSPYRRFLAKVEGALHLILFFVAFRSLKRMKQPAVKPDHRACFRALSPY